MQALVSQRLSVCVWCRSNFCYYLSSPLSLLSFNYLLGKTRVEINVTVRHRQGSQGRENVKQGLQYFIVFIIVQYWTVWGLNSVEKRCLASSSWFSDVTLSPHFPLLLRSLHSVQFSVYFKFKVEKSAVTVQTYRVMFQFHIFEFAIRDMKYFKTDFSSSKSNHISLQV